MTHLKLFFPGLSNGQCLLNLLAPHYALLSTALPEDQTLDTNPQTNKQVYGYKKKQSLWQSIKSNSKSITLFFREKKKSLSFALEDDNDFQQTKEKGNGFIHALQIDDDYNWCDIQTVKSQTASIRNRKFSQFSDTDSMDGDSIVVSIR